MSAAAANNAAWARATRWLSRLAWSRKAGCCAILTLLLAGLALPALATTYTYAGASYTSTNPFIPPCAAGLCANYTTAMRLTGSFTTATPLAADLANVDIRAQVTAFSFTDGINTYSSSDPNARMILFNASTDSAGVPNGSMFIDLHTWITGSTPHTSADRFSEFVIDSNVMLANNLPCSTVGTAAGIADFCLSSGGSDTSTSGAGAPAGVWALAGGGPGSTTNIPIPTLSEWALLLLSGLVSAVGVATVRGRYRR